MFYKMMRLDGGVMLVPLLVLACFRPKLKNGIQLEKSAQ
jgi:hypothetical protein